MTRNPLMTVLIVDDNVNMRGFIKEMLTKLGHNVFEAASGEAGIRSFITDKPDLVLMDIRMEGIDGIEATVKIKSISPEAKIIIVTDYNETSIREQAFAAGADSYLLKENLIELKNELNSINYQ